MKFVWRADVCGWELTGLVEERWFFGLSRSPTPSTAVQPWPEESPSLRGLDGLVSTHDWTLVKWAQRYPRIFEKYDAATFPGQLK